MNSLVLTDRISGLNKAIAISGGRLSFSDTEDEAQDEPVVADKANTGKAYRLFMSGGRLGFEESTVLVDHAVDIVDAVTDLTWRLSVRNARFYMFNSYASISITIRTSTISITATNSSSVNLTGSKMSAVNTSINRISQIN